MGKSSHEGACVSSILLPKYLTTEAESALLGAEKIFFRTSAHPIYQWLEGLGKHSHCFDLLYTMPWHKPEDIYEFMVAILFKEAELKGDVVYAVPGSADVLEETTNLIRNRGIAEGVRVRVISGVSFLDLALAEINFDFSLGLQVVLPLTHLGSGRFTRRLGLIVCQIEAGRSGLDSPRVDITMQYLLKVYNADHPVTLIWTDGLPEYATHSKTFALKDLVREYGEAKFFSSLYVPPIE
jgi:tetrapyrrole methylase family protein / MazG family protein